MVVRSSGASREVVVIAASKSTVRLYEGDVVLRELLGQL